MTEELSDAQRGALKDVQGRVERLRRLVQERIQRAERKRETVVTCGVIVTVACMIFLSLATSNLFQLDAHAITQYGRQEVERQLPGSREALRDYLESQAPAITATLLEELVDALSLLRPYVIRELSTKLQVATAEFEEELVTTLAESVATTKAQLDREFPDATDAEKVEQLVVAVATKLRDSAESWNRELYPKYAAEMEKIRGHLETLRTKPEALLTPRERAEKELIETLLRIVALEQSAYPENR